MPMFSSPLPGSGYLCVRRGPASGNTVDGAWFAPPLESWSSFRAEASTRLPSGRKLPRLSSTRSPGSSLSPFQ